MVLQEGRLISSIKRWGMNVHFKFSWKSDEVYLQENQARVHGFTSYELYQKHFQRFVKSRDVLTALSNI